ncbi:hypothetical protein D3C73_969200 [compost metagenome]
MRSTICGDVITAPMSWFSLSITARGVPAGANTPDHKLTSYVEKPGASEIDGTSGSTGKRWRLVTPSARTLPCFTCSMKLEDVSIIIEIRPARKSLMAPEVPLYGIWRISTPAVDLNISPARWLVVPLPDELNVSSPGRCLASAASSSTEFTFNSGFTTSRFEVRLVSEIGSKLFCGS